MIIEVRGVDFVNKGAELMLHAVIQQIKQWDESLVLAISLRNGNFKQRTEIGLHHLTWLYSAKVPFAGVVLNTAAAILPAGLRNEWHIVRENEVDVILDASGFLYSDDAWPQYIQLSATKFRKLKKAGKKIILLPQAFGPFRNQLSRQLMSEMLAHADLIFARDSQSYAYLRDLDSHSERIKLAPDFTNLVQGVVPDYGGNLEGRPCIIPNYRMIDKTSTATKHKYIPFLIAITRYLYRQGFNPFILIHETGLDYKLAESIKSEIKQPIDTVYETNPLYIKGILGKCIFVIGSRYHSLVSALSQNVPSIGTSWSHKYQSLFEDYNCPECLIDMNSSQEKILENLDLVIEGKSRTSIINRIAESGMRQKTQVQAMWLDIFKVMLSDN